MLKTTEACGTSYVPDDADGNMTAKINKQTSDTTVYIYDIENKLVQVQKAGMLAQYAYDALGRRMSKTVNGSATHYRYDGENLILEMNGNDSVVADYTFGAGIDNPLEMNRNGNNYYYVKDGLGSVTALTNDAGSVVHEYRYAVFGKIVSESGDAVENPFTYTSREYDKETGNYYYRARYYDPQIGRFICEDPKGLKAGDYNLYRYVFNSVINVNDPLGLWSVGGTVSGGIGILGGLVTISVTSKGEVYVTGGLGYGVGLGVSIGASPTDPSEGVTTEATITGGTGILGGSGTVTNDLTGNNFTTSVSGGFGFGYGQTITTSVTVLLNPPDNTQYTPAPPSKDVFSPDVTSVKTNLSTPNNGCQ